MKTDLLGSLINNANTLVATTDFIPTTSFYYALGSSLVLSLAISIHFYYYSSSFSNKSQYLKVIPIVAMSVALIILSIKTSIALSLGLVGALSIVRFRTPVKDPEELAYLFMAIVAGIGSGAAPSIATHIGIMLMLIVLTIIKKITSPKLESSYLCSISFEDISRDNFIKDVGSIIESIGQRYEVARMSYHADQNAELLLYLKQDTPQELTEYTNSISSKVKGKHSIALNRVDEVGF
jgi:uncharacterized membrane protein YhiD involved in acid resistance